MIVYGHHCLRCDRHWDSVHETGDVVCRKCWDRLLRLSDQELLSECEQVVASAKGAFGESMDGLKNHRDRLASEVERSQRPMRRIWLRYRPNRDLQDLKRLVADAEGRLELAGVRVRLAEQLSGRLRGPRVRLASAEVARAQLKQARQERRTGAYAAALAALVVDRAALAIGRRDYRRGNAIDNHFRARWMARISEAYGEKCFLCGSKNGFTLDHLWLTKNEGGNFAVCVREAGALISNVLLLCRSCNSAKGERSIDRLVSSARLSELVATQRVLSDQMNDDAELQRLATRWYGVHIGLPDTGMQPASGGSSFFRSVWSAAPRSSDG